jgi:hypothetical protein
MDLDFYKIFTKYKFGNMSIITHVFKIMSFREMFWLAYAFVTLNNSHKNMTTYDYCKKHNFSDEAIDFIDRLCRMSDGTDIKRYTLYQFIQLFNQNVLYSIYQPIQPNDEGLFSKWHDKLLNNNTDILLNTEVKELLFNNGKVSGVVIDDAKFNAESVILAIPPEHILKLLKFNGYFNNELERWVELTKYNPYKSIAYHWDKKVNISKIWGFPQSEWGIAFIVLTDYMDFNDSRSQTVISTTISIFDKRSKYLNKLPNECTEQELKDEVFRQLKEILNLPSMHKYTDAVINKTNDKAFVMTQHGAIPFKLTDNLYTVGTHNGFSDYAFTSMESAVTNAMHLSNYLLKSNIKIGQAPDFYYVIKIIISIIIIIVLILILS